MNRKQEKLASFFKSDLAFLRLLELATVTVKPNITLQVDDWMASVDTNKDGCLSYKEFKKSLEGKMSIRG